MSEVTYKDAGVDTEEGQNFVRAIAESVKSTHSQHVFGLPGGFSSLFDISFLKDYNHPVLVSSTDGVGTKLHLASLFDRHETVGIDLVAMCTNDLLVNAAKPLFFLDYIACGKLNTEKMAAIVSGIAEGCKQAGCSLVGGETAEHPGTMAPEDYDLAGFVVGAVEKNSIIDGSTIQEGDVIVGLPSSGIHSNGISLLRKLFLKNGTEMPQSKEDQDFLLNEILLKPTIIYEPILRPLLESQTGTKNTRSEEQKDSASEKKKSSVIKGMVHITGGGYFENIPRILPDHLAADIHYSSLPAPFSRIAEKINISQKDLYSTFNMGYGMLLIMKEDDARANIPALQKVINTFRPVEQVRIIGNIVKREDTAVILRP